MAIASRRDDRPPRYFSKRPSSAGADRGRSDYHVLVLSETKARGKGGRVLEGFERLATPPRRRPTLKPKKGSGQIPHKYQGDRDKLSESQRVALEKKEYQEGVLEAMYQDKRHRHGQALSLLKEAAMLAPGVRGRAGSAFEMTPGGRGDAVGWSPVAWSRRRRGAVDAAGWSR